MSDIEEAKRLLEEALDHLDTNTFKSKDKYLTNIGRAKRRITDALAVLDSMEEPEAKKRYLYTKSGGRIEVPHPLDLVAKGPSGKIIYAPGCEPPAEEEPLKCPKCGEAYYNGLYSHWTAYHGSEPMPITKEENE